MLIVDGGVTEEQGKSLKEERSSVVFIDISPIQSAWPSEMDPRLVCDVAAQVYSKYYRMTSTRSKRRIAATSK